MLKPLVSAGSGLRCVSYEGEKVPVKRCNQTKFPMIVSKTWVVAPVVVSQAYLVILAIVMLNLLIAVLSTAHGEVREV